MRIGSSDAVFTERLVHAVNLAAKRKFTRYAMATDDDLNFSMILASSVHDMKNSLSMLLGTLDQLSGECGHTCPATGKVNQLRYQGQRLNGDLVQLLSIYKIEHQQYTPNIDEHDLADFLQECVNTHEPLLTPRGITIEAVCDPGLLGYFDREMVAGVVNNVVNNAYKYSKDRIRLSAADSDGYVVVSVADNGSGYPPSMLRTGGVEAGRTNFTSGSTSLGLYFASLIARIHTNKDKRGYIRCANEGIDGGGLFSMMLP